MGLVSYDGERLRIRIPRYLRFKIPDYRIDTPLKRNSWFLLMLIFLSGFSDVFATSEYAYYTLNEGSGNAVDNTGSFTLTQSGTVHNITGKLGNARGTYSAGNYFSISSGVALASNEAWSVVGWIKQNTTSSADSLILGNFIGAESNDKWKIYLYSDNSAGNDRQARFRLCTWTGSAEANIQEIYTSAIDLNDAWVFVSFQYNTSVSNNMKACYNNGNCVYGTYNAGGLSTGKLGLGGAYSYTSMAYSIKDLDDFRIYKSYLTNAELSTLYNAGAGYYYSLNFSAFVEDNYHPYLITDNSTSHFFMENTSQILNFNAFNNTANLSGLQMLQYNISALNTGWVNVTAGSNFNVTFNGSVSNYSVVVRDYYNSSVNVSAYFYTANVGNWSSVFSSNVLSGEDNWVNSSFVGSAPVGAVFYNSTKWNNTYYLGLSNNFVVNVVGYNVTVLWDSYVNISFGGVNLSFNDTLRSQTFYYPFIDNCSSFGTRALNITWLDEVNDSLISNVSGSIYMGVVMPVGNSLNYNFSFDDVDGVGLCIYPAWASYDFSANLSYERSGYFGREYYYSDSSLNNVTDVLSLYLLEDTVGDRIDFEVVDQFNNELEGYYVLVKRWYSVDDAYLLVDVVCTNYLGEASSYIQYSGTQNVYYEVLVEDPDHVPVYTISKQRYYDPIQTLRITITEGSNDFLETRGNFVFSSNVVDVQNLTTSILSGTLTDTSGASILGGVNVFRVYSGNMTIVSGCNNSAVSNSLTVACDLGNVTGKTFFVEAYAIYDSVRFVVFSDYLYFESYMDYGDNGLIVGVVLFGFLIFAGMYVGASSGSMVIGGLFGYFLALIINGAFSIVYINPVVSSVLWGFGLVIAGLCLWRVE